MSPRATGHGDDEPAEDDAAAPTETATETAAPEAENPDGPTDFERQQAIDVAEAEKAEKAEAAES